MRPSCIGSVSYTHLYIHDHKNPNSLANNKVKCQMERNDLRLKSGQKGILKKGMTVSAHFMICLLYTSKNVNVFVVEIKQ